MPERHGGRYAGASAIPLLLLMLAACAESPIELRSPVVFRDKEPQQQASPPARTSPGVSRATVAIAHVGAEASNLRAGPGMRYRIIGTAAPGARLEVLDEESGWLEVRNGSHTAWIAERLTRPTPTVVVPAGPPATAGEPPPAGTGASRTDDDTAGDDQGVLPNF